MCEILGLHHSGIPHVLAIIRVAIGDCYVIFTNMVSIVASCSSSQATVNALKLALVSSSIQSILQECMVYIVYISLF